MGTARPAKAGVRGAGAVDRDSLDERTRAAIEQIDDNLLREIGALQKLVEAAPTEGARDEALERLNRATSALDYQASDGDSSFLGKAAGGALKALSPLTVPASIANRAAIAAFGGRPPGLTDEEWAKDEGVLGTLGYIFAPAKNPIEDATGFGDVLESKLDDQDPDADHGIFGGYEFPLLGKIDGRDLGGFAGDLLLDPLNAVGAGGFAKVAHATDAAGDVAKVARTAEGAGTIASRAVKINRFNSRSAIVERIRDAGASDELAARVLSRGTAGVEDELAEFGYRTGLSVGVGRNAIIVPGTEKIGRLLAPNVARSAHLGGPSRGIGGTIRAGLDRPKIKGGGIRDVIGDPKKVARIRAADNYLAAPSVETEKAFKEVLDVSGTARGILTGGSSKTQQRLIAELASGSDSVRAAKRQARAFTEAGLDVNDAIEQGLEEIVIGKHTYDLAPVRAFFAEARELMEGAGYTGEFIEGDYFTRVREASTELGPYFLKNRSLKKGGEFFGQILETGNIEELRRIGIDNGFDVDLFYKTDTSSVMTNYMQQVGNLVGMSEAATHLRLLGYGIDSTKDGFPYLRNIADGSGRKVPADVYDELLRTVPAEARKSILALDSVAVDQILDDPASWSLWAKRQRNFAINEDSKMLWGAASEAAAEGAALRTAVKSAVDAVDLAKVDPKAIQVYIEDNKVIRHLVPGHYPTLDEQVTRSRLLLNAAHESGLRATMNAQGMATPVSTARFGAWVNELNESPALAEKLTGLINGQSMTQLRTGQMLPTDVVEALTHVVTWRPGNDFTLFLNKAVSIFKRSATGTPGFSVRNLYGGLFQEYNAGHTIVDFHKFARDFKLARSGRLSDIKDPLRRDAMSRIASGMDVDVSTRIQSQILDGRGSLPGTRTTDATTPAPVRRAAVGPDGAALPDTGPNHPRLAALPGKLGRNFDAFTSTLRADRPVGGALNAAAGGGLSGVPVETLLRGSHIYAEVGLGASYEAARSSMLRYHFDYGDLTANEQAIQGTLIPFLTWRARNFPLQMELLMRRPGNASRLIKWQTTMQERATNPLQPNYYEGFLSFPTANDPDLVFNPDLPFNDILGTAQDLNGMNAAKLALLDSSPLLKTSLEIATNRSFFTGGQINPDYRPVNQIMGVGVPSFVPGIGGRTYTPTIPNALASQGAFQGAVYNLSRLIGGEGIVVAADGTVYVDEALNYGLTQNLPILGQLRRLFPNDEYYQSRAEAAWLSYFGNFTRRITPFDERSEAYRRADDAEREVNVFEETGYLEERG